MDRDDTHGAGSYRGDPNSGMGASQGQEPTWNQQTQVASTYPPLFPRCQRIMVQMALDGGGCLCWITGSGQRSCARLTSGTVSMGGPWELKPLPTLQIRQEMGDSKVPWWG